MDLEQLLEQTRAKRDAKELQEFQTWIKRRATALVETIGLDLARELNIRFQIDRQAVFYHAEHRLEFRWSWTAREEKFCLTLKREWSEKDINSVDDLLDALVQAEQKPSNHSLSGIDAPAFPCEENQNFWGLTLLEFFAAIYLNKGGTSVGMAIGEAKRTIAALRPPSSEPDVKYFTLDEVLAFKDPPPEPQPDQQSGHPYDDIPF